MFGFTYIIGILKFVFYSRGVGKEASVDACYWDPKKMTFTEVMAAVSIAIEGDVARASSLAKDLNIARPPLIVKAPVGSESKTSPKDMQHNIPSQGTNIYI